MVRRITLGLIVALTLGALACGARSQPRPIAMSTIDYIMPPTATAIGTSTATRTAAARATASPTPALPTPSPTPTAPPPTPTVAGPPAPVATAAPPTAPAAAAQSEGAIRPLGASGYNGQCGSYSSGVTQWWAVVNQYDWDPCMALEVIATESGGANVYNSQGSGACGVMQLLPCQYPDDGASNIAAGYAKYAAAGGWSPWTSFWG